MRRFISHISKLGASNDDHNMTTQTNYKPTVSKPLGNAVFAHCQSQRDRQTQLAKSKNSSRKTLVALSKGSILFCKFLTTRQQKNKNKAVASPPPFLSFGAIQQIHYN